MRPSAAKGCTSNGLLGRYQRPGAPGQLGRPIPLDRFAGSPEGIYETAFPLLEETPSIYPVWKNLVNALAIIGKQVHDARLVAVCRGHAVSHILTFNVGHFARMSGFGSGVVVVDPATV